MLNRRGIQAAFKELKIINQSIEEIITLSPNINNINTENIVKGLKDQYDMYEIILSESGDLNDPTSVIFSEIKKVVILEHDVVNIKEFIDNCMMLMIKHKRIINDDIQQMIANKEVKLFKAITNFKEFIIRKNDYNQYFYACLVQYFEFYLLYKMKGLICSLSV